MDEVYHARHYRAGDEEEIVGLLKSVFPEWSQRENALDYWRWKYLDTPLGSNVAVATFADEIVAVDHFMNFKMKIGQTFYPTQYMDEAATHPEHRGKHAHRLVDNVLDADQEAMGIKTTYTIPINPIMINRRNPRHVFLPQPIIHIIRVRDADRYLSGKDVANPRLAGLAIKTLSLRVSLRNRVRSRAVSNIRVEETDHFGDSVDSLWGKVNTGLSFTLDRGKDYLNWRYCDKRGGNYMILQAHNEGQLVGYIVAQLRNRGAEAEAFIMDLIYPPEEPWVAEVLAKSLLEKLDALRVNSVNYKAVAGNPSIKLLGPLGFITPPIQQSMMLRIEMNYLPLTYFEEVTKAPSEKLRFSYGDYFQ